MYASLVENWLVWRPAHAKGNFGARPVCVGGGKLGLGVAWHAKVGLTAGHATVGVAGPASVLGFILARRGFFGCLGVGGRAVRTLVPIRPCPW